MLTAQGLDTLGNAAPAHVESVRHHFIDRLAPTDLAALEQIGPGVASREVVYGFPPKSGVWSRS
ncbi:hypothetical protein ACFWOL_31240 [Streptomyces sp. NPDC058442]|uniref:hypothetical protein n=1 Tax=Streptomyces sp. NPDC058442 TaxID=3346503 RepID=UPI003655496C